MAPVVPLTAEEYAAFQNGSAKTSDGFTRTHRTGMLDVPLGLELNMATPFADCHLTGYFSEYGNDAWERMTRKENPDRSIEVGYEMVYHFPKGRFPHNASVYAFDYTVYAKQTTARVLRKTEFREDGQPLKDIRSKDGLEDVRISSNTEAIDFVYSDNGLLSEIVSADETVFLTFDRNGNLTRLQNETYKYTTDYEWTAVQIPGLY
jgi:hypothetical protein